MQRPKRNLLSHKKCYLYRQICLWVLWMGLRKQKRVLQWILHQRKFWRRDTTFRHWRAISTVFPPVWRERQTFLSSVEKCKTNFQCPVMSNRFCSLKFPSEKKSALPMMKGSTRRGTLQFQVRSCSKEFCSGYVGVMCSEPIEAIPAEHEEQSLLLSLSQKFIGPSGPSFGCSIGKTEPSFRDEKTIAKWEILATWDGLALFTGLTQQNQPHWKPHINCGSRWGGIGIR